MRAMLFINLFHSGVELLNNLTEKGIEPVYITRVAKHHFPNDAVSKNCVIQENMDVVTGKFPKILEERGEAPIVPDPEILSQLLDCERIVIPMMERLNYYNVRVRGLHSLYMKYLACWLGIFKALRPEVIIFHNRPHLGSNFVCYSLAKLFGIQIVILEGTGFMDRVLILDNIYEFPPFPNDYVSKSTIKLEDPIMKLKQSWKAERMKMINKRGNFMKLIKSALRLFHSIRYWGQESTNMVGVYATSEKKPSVCQSRLHEFLGTIKGIHLRRWYDRNSQEPEFSVPYLYFPLHVEPERTILPDGNYFWNQLYVLDVLLTCLPKGWHIYVMEHTGVFFKAPVYLSIGRDLGFYQRLIEDERVKFIDLKCESGSLIGNADCVATVCGTSGWEAVCKGVPAMFFGSPWYKSCPEIYRVNKIEGCREYLQQIASGKRSVDVENVKRYALWIRDEVGYKGNQFIHRYPSSFTQVENAHNLAESIIDFLNRKKNGKCC